MAAILFLAAAAAIGQPANDYRNEDAWLCRPARSDVCAGDIGVTQVDAAGRAVVEHPAPTAEPTADCFYVYPTVSLDPTPNSDMIAGREELGMTAAQFAPFRGVCRTFAPLYRQITLTALRARLGGKPDLSDHELAYRDVRDAWRNYLARDNHGRPVVLVGHSQGSQLLKRLLVEEIDGKSAQRLLLSAILPGTAVLVPVGKIVGGDLKAIPLCRASRQTGCVVTWGSYRDTPGPPAYALFGRSPSSALEAGCTNPARLEGGSAPLDGLLGYPRWKGGVAQFAKPAVGWSVHGDPVTTPFVRLPGLLTGQCASRGGVNYLAVHVARVAAKPLAEAMVGSDAVGDIAYPEWGFHVMDMAIVEGDLIRLIRRQTIAWRQKH